ncbi:MAG: GatB/YqeY domain-containing protein [Patescibacteria group bacterium]
MPLRNEIQDKLQGAMKSGDAKRLSVLRLIKSAVKNEEIQLQKELSDEEVQAVVGRQVKQLSEALKDFEAGGRQDLIAQTKEEIEIMSVYLPKQMSDEELTAVIEKAIETLGAKTAGDIGKVMGLVVKQTKGKADGSKVREMVSKKLTPQ